METKFILLFLAIGLMWVNPAVAINVPDGTFDEHDVGDGLWSYVNDVEGHDWISESTGGGTPWIGNNYGNGYPTMGHTGAQFIDMNSAIIHQTLSGKTYEKGVDYELSMYVTTTYGGQSLDIHFLDGDDWENPLASQSFDVAIEADLATWSRYSFMYTATSEDHGKPIGIAFWGDYNTWSDTVSLFGWLIMPATPTNEMPNVAVDDTLDWTAPTEFDVSGYDVYFGTDPNKLGNPLVVDNELTTTFDPFGAGDMAHDTTYYWWADVYEPNLVAPFTPIRHVTDDGLTFTTVPAVPVIGADPVSIVVDAGGPAAFTVEHTSGMSYEWYKVGVVDPIDSGTTASGETITLSLASVSQSDEGYYYCKVINDDAPEGVDSAEAKLMTKRLVGHWSMDGTGTDRNVADSSLGGVDGTVVSRNVTDVETEVPDPGAGWTWETGINGQALNLAQNAVDPDVHDYVILATSGDPTDLEFGETTDFSVSVWIKGTDFNVVNGDAALISNKDWNSGGNPGWVMDINGGTDQLEWNIGSNGRADYDPSGGAALNDDEWHHLVATHDRDGNATFYVDGILQDTRNIAFIGNINSGYPTVIGTDGAQGTVWAAWFRGLVDDVRMWNYVINPYAVAALYTEFVPTAEKWCVENASIPDHNNSCTVDMADAAAIASMWAACNIVPDCLDQHDYSVE